MSGERRTLVIALLTDLGTADTYVGVMKAVVLSLCPEAHILDLCHEVAPQDIHQAAFLLARASEYCPAGTVHVVVVDPGVGTHRRVLAVEAGGQRFVAPDNGVLTYVLAEAGDYRAYSVERREHFLPHVSATFHGRDIMAPVAARLADGLPIEAVGPAVRNGLEAIVVPRPVAVGDALEVHVVHVDRFGNLVTDLTERALRDWQEEKAATRVVVEAGGRTVEGVRGAYGEVAPGELLAVVGSAGCLELAVNMGSAAAELRLGRGAALTVRGGR